jgi:hypothetical protein
MIRGDETRLVQFGLGGSKKRRLMTLGRSSKEIDHECRLNDIGGVRDESKTSAYSRMYDALHAMCTGLV